MNKDLQGCFWGYQKQNKSFSITISNKSHSHNDPSISLRGEMPIPFILTKANICVCMCIYTHTFTLLEEYLNTCTMTLLFYYLFPLTRNNFQRRGKIRKMRKIDP